jgi:hypothetical protein
VVERNGESELDSCGSPDVGSGADDPIALGVGHARVLALGWLSIGMGIRPAVEAERLALEHALDQFEQFVLAHRNSLVLPAR